MELTDSSEALLLSPCEVTPRIPEVPPFGLLLCLPPQLLIFLWSSLSRSSTGLPSFFSRNCIKQDFTKVPTYVLWASFTFDSPLEKGQFLPLQSICFFLHYPLRLMAKVSCWSHTSPSLLSFRVVSLKPTPSRLDIKERAPLPRSLWEREKRQAPSKEISLKILPHLQSLDPWWSSCGVIFFGNLCFCPALLFGMSCYTVVP